LYSSKAQAAVFLQWVGL